MKQFTVKNQILQVFNDHPKGTIFSINDFYHLATKNTIKSALLRMERENKIVRLISGLYVMPEYSVTIQEYSYPPVETLAYKIADKFAWSICPAGNNALNLTGLSTQVPSEFVYISDGPYRQFEYFNIKIIYNHSSNRNISEYSKNLSIAIQAIKALGEKNVTSESIKILARFCKKYVKEDLILDTKKLPFWIQDVFKKIDKEMKII